MTTNCWLKKRGIMELMIFKFDTIVQQFPGQLPWGHNMVLNSAKEPFLINWDYQLHN
jgi:hypothetical protein